MAVALNSDERECFLYRCKMTRVGSFFGWNGVKVEKYGYNKYKVGEVKGNAGKIFDEVKRLSEK